MIALIITLATFAYTMLDKFVFAPDRKKGDQQSIFNFTDFPRPKDKYGRMPQSIFTALRGSLFTGDEWWDRAVSYAGDKNECLDGFVDTGKNFNAGNLFELFAFLNYWVSGAQAKALFFDNIMNPMFNVGLITNTTPAINNRFTATSARFFWLYDDYLKLKHIAEAPDGKFNLVVYTRNRKDAHNIDSKPYAIALLGILQNYPFSSGYFIDGLTDPTEIMNREVQILTDITPVVEPAKPKPVNNPPADTPALDNSISGSTKKASTVSTIAEKVFIGLIVSAIIFFFFSLIKKHK